MKKKFIFLFTAAMSCLGAFADNQFYVVLKDGSAESYPLDNVDSLTFDAPDGARVIGLADLLQKYANLESRVTYLEKNCCCKDSSLSLFLIVLHLITP